MDGKRSLRRHSAKELLGVRTDAERIIAFLQSDVDDVHERNQLTPALHVKLERIITAKSLLLQHKFVPKVQKMLMHQYGYTIGSAITDLNLCYQVFGPIMHITREMRRVIADEMIRQDRDLAVELKDVKALNQATANYIKLHQLDKDEAELPDVSHFTFHQNIIAVLPEQVGINPVSEDELLKRVGEWLSKDAENTDYEQLEG
jgi:hypothetical protein